MRYYAVIDTNVLVSALLKKGSFPWQVAEEALRGDIIPLVNDEILAEYEDVLARPKFRFEQRAVRVLLDELRKRAVFTDAGLIEDEIPDPKDVVFYAVLMEKRQEEEAYLVTGNIKHFPARTFVVTPREMVDILQESGYDPAEPDRGAAEKDPFYSESNMARLKESEKQFREGKVIVKTMKELEDMSDQ